MILSKSKEWTKEDLKFQTDTVTFPIMLWAATHIPTKLAIFFIITILLICKTTDTVTLHTPKLQYNSSQTKACVTIAVLKVLAKASYRMQGLLLLKWHHSPNNLQLTWTHKSFSLILFSVATDPSDLGTKRSSGTKLLAKLHPTD